MRVIIVDDHGGVSERSLGTCHLPPESVLQLVVSTVVSNYLPALKMKEKKEILRLSSPEILQPCPVSPDVVDVKEVTEEPDLQVTSKTIIPRWFIDTAFQDKVLAWIIHNVRSLLTAIFVRLKELSVKVFHLKPSVNTGRVCVKIVVVNDNGQVFEQTVDCEFPSSYAIKLIAKSIVPNVDNPSLSETDDGTPIQKTVEFDDPNKVQVEEKTISSMIIPTQQDPNRRAGARGEISNISSTASNTLPALKSF